MLYETANHQTLQIKSLMTTSYLLFVKHF
jgi:hypothetical protein